jgi:hypothetical protein
MYEARVGFRSYHHVSPDNVAFSRDRFLIKYDAFLSRREFSPSIRKDVKVTIPVRPWFPEPAAAKAERMNDEAHTTLSRTDEPGDQRKILDAAGGET